MEVCPASSLELTISVPGFSSSPSLLSSGEGSGLMRDLDINQVPNGGPSRKKLRLTKEQSRFLEKSFKQNHTLNPKEKEALAIQLRLKPRQVEVWFQNRRARGKLKHTEMECQYLKRWYGSLTEQSRRLQKELEELRAMKVGPPTMISPHSRVPLPASTLTMCPRCERVTTTIPDKGPSKTTTTTTPATNPATLSAKVPILPSRHTSTTY
ncbi:unnamed protein product [Ilex paraguariensis]|uniref:Homeobox domain-containing protein n=1 Tax=Ilex paraguariensis TaxID=185542 RepID=A0ABC8SK50_9AQUA